MSARLFYNQFSMHNHSHIHFSDVAKQTAGRLSLSLFLTLAFVFVEATAGLIANSLALLTDAAHNFTDVIALGISWYAVHLTAQPSNSRNTYGYHRAGILAALLNSTALVLISLGIFYEAYRRFIIPPQVNSTILIGVGFLAFIVNLMTALLLRRGSQDDLNLRSSFVHMIGDVASAIGAVIAGVIIYFTHAGWLDAFVSILIGFLILYSAWGILRETVDILLESTPRDVDISAMVRDMMQVKGVIGIHDLHVWSITHGLRTMSAHVLTEDMSISAGADIQREINEVAFHHYNIQHAALQLECVNCEPDSLYCDINDIVHHHEHV
jgi:cobalt-zinc-cadmium efflux system protein